MQDGCKVYVESYVASTGSCVMVTWNIFINNLSEVGLTQKAGDHNTLTISHICSFVLFYHVWGPSQVDRSSLE